LQITKESKVIIKDNQTTLIKPIFISIFSNIVRVEITIPIITRIKINKVHFFIRIFYERLRVWCGATRPAITFKLCNKFNKKFRTTKFCLNSALHYTHCACCTNICNYLNFDNKKKKKHLKNLFK